MYHEWENQTKWGIFYQAKWFFSYPAIPISGIWVEAAPWSQNGP